MIILQEPSTTREFEQYYDLRWRVLRAPVNQPRGSERDALEDTSFHMSVMDGGKVIGVGRLHAINSNEARIRYMAVEHGYERKGIGSRILKALEHRACETGIKLIWLNARLSAEAFYAKQGYRMTQPGEIMFGCLPHHRMEKIL